MVTPLPERRMVEYPGGYSTAEASVAEYPGGYSTAGVSVAEYPGGYSVAGASVAEYPGGYSTAEASAVPARGRERKEGGSVRASWRRCRPPCGSLPHRRSYPPVSMSILPTSQG